MQIFVFEFITGGGWHLVDPAHAPRGSLLRQGRAMADSVAEDLATIEDVQVVRMIDSRLNDQHVSQGDLISVQGAGELIKQFALASANADFSLVIAPEFDDHLTTFAERVLESGGKLLGPSPEFIRLTGDKHRTAQWLANARVPTPTGMLLSPGKTVPSDFPFPAILKPIDGAGSLNTLRIDNVARLEATKMTSPMRLESYHFGTSVSVAAICGCQAVTLLAPCLQRLSDGGDFSYLGGACPIDDGLAERASRLAERALRAFPRPTGYIGIDMILGNAPTGSEDVVIEVNPRLTTSYVGLRELVEQNLAEAMLLATRGYPVELSLRPRRVEFSADGNVTILPE